MSYQVTLNPAHDDVAVYAVVRDLSVDFDHGVESVRIRSTETPANAIKRAYPAAQIFERDRFGVERRIA